ncbi:MAG: hypothetical protein HOP22_07910 [Nitrospiraceae bacterium]|nr:hypothetical protein [Nitrospiraceae bacterium]
MNALGPTYTEKIYHSLPWLTRYPFWRLGRFLQGLRSAQQHTHLIVTVANHYEPGWAPGGGCEDRKTQLSRVREWHREARITGRLIKDADGTPFRHTAFYPGEQYDPALLEVLAEMQAEGLGEVEIHLHHGTEQPDTPQNLKASLIGFRDLLADKHRCLSRSHPADIPRYAFVHGNFALANSRGGFGCGVDNEMEILAETGCYIDMTLPAFPHEAQVPKINAVYQCGRPLHEAVPHRCGPSLRVHGTVAYPVIMTGPLVFEWTRKRWGLPFPRVDDGVLTANYHCDLARLDRWRGAQVSVQGRPEWIFIKLYCHGFFQGDLEATLGDPMRRFWGTALEEGSRTGAFTVHFASAREAFNIALAAVHDKKGSPHSYRDYSLRPIMQPWPAEQKIQSSIGNPGTIRQAVSLS